MEGPLGLPRIWNQVGCSRRCRLRAMRMRDGSRTAAARLWERGTGAPREPPQLVRRLVCTFLSWMRFVNRFVSVKCADVDPRVPCALTRWRIFRLQVTRSFGNLTVDAASTSRGGGGGAADPGLTSSGGRSTVSGIQRNECNCLEPLPLSDQTSI